MRYMRFAQTFAFLTAFVMILAGAGETFAQGKGKGGGGGKHGGGHPGGGNGNGGGKHGGGNPFGGNPGRGNGNRAAMPVAQPNGGYQVMQRGNGNGKHGRGNVIIQNQIPIQIQRQAPAYYPQYNPQVYAQTRGNGKNKDKGRGNGKFKDRGNYQVQVPVYAPAYKNYGQQRKAEVHQRNAERKAFKEEMKAGRTYSAQQQYYGQTYPQQRYSRERRYVPTAPIYDQTYTQQYYQQQPQEYRYYPQQSPIYQQQYPAYQQPYYNGGYSQPYYGGGYAQPYYGQYAPMYDVNDDGNVDIGDMLRNIIFSVIADKAGLNQGYYPQDNGYGYDQAYYPGANSGYSQYASYGPAPYTASYPAMGGYYAPQYDNQYGYGDQLPVHLLMANTGLGGEVTSEMFSQLLALGYEQGYQHGLTARQTRVRNEEYYDPYAYNNDAYDPYSVSLGDNRRFLSEGYGLGYQDALNNVNDYENVSGDGQVDLVSLLIGTVSQLI